MEEKRWEKNDIRFVLNVDELLGLIQERKENNSLRVDFKTEHFDRVVQLVREIERDMPKLQIKINGKTTDV